MNGPTGHWYWWRKGVCPSTLSLSLSLSLFFSFPFLLLFLLLSLSLSVSSSLSAFSLFVLLISCLQEVAAISLWFYKKLSMSCLCRCIRLKRNQRKPRASGVPWPMCSIHLGKYTQWRTSCT